ncbi:zinc finger protein, RING-type [Haematococcus lacustris]|uniref:RING-type E3 ubiquitin transferase n=1 Tax=Haematococcus lacustris TaxID=44745 RepID=A0A699YEH9_HAELA|nr:zinc finger protein, RING-type [Haematococcus lacustris]
MPSTLLLALTTTTGPTRLPPSTLPSTLGPTAFPPPASHPHGASQPGNARTQEYQRTATIRNQVNLKKPTLKLQNVPGSADRMVICFTFDASAPCRVVIALNAAEETRKGCCLRSEASLPPALAYDKGLEQKFPRSDEVVPAALTLPQSRLQELLSLPAGGDRMPVVIRLEALTDEGRADGRDLHSLEPGSELPHWVQTQTTYARVLREEDGSLGLRVVKQKIWVKGEAYELQEIYGMEQNKGVAMGLPATATGDGLEEVDGNECVICLSASRDTAALPCRHMCMCHQCASALKTQTNKCPICRNEIESLLHIKINKGGASKPA